MNENNISNYREDGTHKQKKPHFTHILHKHIMHKKIVSPITKLNLSSFGGMPWLTYQ